MGWTDMGCSMGYSSMDCSTNRSMTWIPPRFHRLLVTSAENTLRHYHSMLKAKKVFLYKVKIRADCSTDFQESIMKKILKISK